MAVASEVVLMIGTSGKVSPARQLPILAKREPNPSKVVEINLNTTLLSAHANIRLIGPSAVVLPKLYDEIKFLELRAGRMSAALPRVDCGSVQALAAEAAEAKGAA